MIVDRLLARQVLGAVAAALGVLVALLLLIDFLESARALFAGDAGVADVLLLYLMKLPALIQLVLPVALVVGSCAAFASLGRSLQLRALAAAGLGRVRLVRPVLFVCLGVVLSGWAVSEFLVPLGLDRMERLMMERFGRIDSSWRFFGAHQWLQGDGGRLFRVGSRSADGSNLRGVLEFDLDDDGLLRRRLDVHSASYTAGRWRGSFVVERVFSGAQQVAFRNWRERELDWTEAPVRFRDLSGRPQQHRLAVLQEVICELERRGIPALEHRLDRHLRFSHPVLGLVLVLLYFPWLARPQRRRTLAGALLESVLLVFAGYVSQSFATSLVSGGSLSPVLGGWVPVLLLSSVVALHWGVWLVWVRGRGAR